MTDNPLSIADVLDRAADLIEPEGAWTRFTMARTKDGRAVSETDEEAVSFCVLGAIRRIAVGRSKAEQFLVAVACPHHGLATVWNNDDRRTQSEVVSALRLASSKARKQERGAES